MAANHAFSVHLVLTLHCLAQNICTQCQNFNFRKDHQKNSYESRDYESVDEKSLS